MKYKSLLDIIEHNNFICKNAPSDNPVVLGEMYGKERFCYLLYSLTRMEQPKTVVELGAGVGTCSFLIAQALKENDSGMLWTIDNGQEWHQYQLDVQEHFETHKEYFNYLTDKFGLQRFIRLVDNFDLTKNLVFDPMEKIDLLFADAAGCDPTGCMKVLRGYLPIMSPRSNIFIDRASTINHSYLYLEKVISDLQNNKIHNSLLQGLTKGSQELLQKFVSRSKFTLIHLPEKDTNKVNQLQNSTAWIRIEPLDFYFDDDVINLQLNDEAFIVDKK